MPVAPRSYVAVTFSPQPSVAYFLRGVLESAGFSVTAAAFQADDLEAAVERTRPDVVVYDVSFPFKENWNQCQQLLRRPAFYHIPLVVTTSERRELFRTVGVSAAVELFSRPDDVTELRTAVRRAIETANPLQVRVS